LKDSLLIYSYTLAESILLKREGYSQLIISLDKIAEIKEQIDLKFIDIKSNASQTFWLIVSQY